MKFYYNLYANMLSSFRGAVPAIRKAVPAFRSKSGTALQRFGITICA
jgi:hypothetical protein